MAKNTDKFEQSLERLAEITTELEKGDLPLEDGVALFKEGLALARTCGQKLETARHEVNIVSEGLLKEFDQLDNSDNDED